MVSYLKIQMTVAEDLLGLKQKISHYQHEPRVLLLHFCWCYQHTQDVDAQNRLTCHVALLGWCNIYFLVKNDMYILIELFALFKRLPASLKKVWKSTMTYWNIMIRKMKHEMFLGVLP